MQQIERYGVIALLLLLVTVLAVSMWGDEEVGKNEPTTPTLASAPATRRAETPERRAPLRTPATQRPRRENSRLTNHLSLSSSAQSTTPRNNTRETPRTTRRKTTQLPRKNDTARANLELPKQNTTIPVYDTAANRNFALVDSGRRREAEQNANLIVHKDPVQPKTEPTPRRDPVRTRPKTTPVATQTGTWVVKRGETLSGIASKAMGSAKAWPKIAAANPNVDPNRLMVGAKLVIPTRDQTVTPKTTPKRNTDKTSKTTPKAGGTYTIRSGDVLSRVAQRELGSAKRWPEIVKLNPGLNPDRLIVGKRIQLPEGVARTTPDTRVAVAQSKPRSTKRRRVR